MPVKKVSVSKKSVLDLSKLRRINTNSNSSSVEAVTVETAPVETAPVETALVETAPVEAAPVETVAKLSLKEKIALKKKNMAKNVA